MGQLYDERLEYERFIAELLQVRKSPQETRWYTSPSLTATMTAVLTVIATSIGSYKIQERARSQDTFMQRQQDLFKKKQEVAIQTFEQLSRIMKASADRLLLATGYFDAFPKAQRDVALAQSNQADDLWRLERDNLELLVHVYFGGDSASTAAWDNAVRAVSIYGDCIENAYLSSQERRASETACATEKNAAEERAVIWRDRASNILQREFSKRQW